MTTWPDVGCYVVMAVCGLVALWLILKKESDE